ncbi:MAG: hypothetical protein Q9215_006301 [Flavoplaca cf. flavocitrina]
MDLRVPQVFSYIRKKHLHLLAFPSKYLREQPERESLEAVFDLDKMTYDRLSASHPQNSRRDRSPETQSTLQA